MRIRCQLLTAIAPTLLRTLQVLLAAPISIPCPRDFYDSRDLESHSSSQPFNPMSVWLCYRLCIASVVTHNNLLIDDVLQLLVSRTHLSLQPALLSHMYISPTGINTVKQDVPAGKKILWLEYEPLRNIREFGRVEDDRSGVRVAVDCYRALGIIVKEFGSSIQKGYMDIVG